MKIKNPEPALESLVLRFIQEHHLVLPSEPLLVAVSGGPDSVCLLHILVKLQDELGIRLHVAHLNHQLRGADSEGDAQYVAELANRLGIPATIERRDVKAYRAQQRLSLEEAAREVRYTFLTEVAKSIGASRAAVGHTSDDHVETILMHLVRGSGTRGLRGLQPCSGWQCQGSSLTVIRPLLSISREDTVSCCRRHQLMPRLDVSNLSLSPLRNRIRLELLPLMQSYNPQVTEALLRMAQIARDDLDFINEESKQLWEQIAQERENTIILNRERFLELPRALKRHLLRVAIEKLIGLKDIETRHIDQLVAALNKPAGRKISLPEGLSFVVEYDRYLLGLDPAALSPFPIMEGEFALAIPGETHLPGWQVEATVLDPSAVKGKLEGANAPSKTTTPLPLDKGKGTKGIGLVNNDFTAYFDRDKTGDRLTVRARQRGDRFQPLGMSQPKKVGEFMIDARIPQAWRGRIPLVCSPGQIVWIVGWRIDERVKVTEATRQVLCLEFKRG